MAQPIDAKGLVENQGNLGAELAAKKQTVNEVAKPPVEQAPIEVNKTPSVKDRVNPTARYGSRPGEKRIDVTGMTKPLGVFDKGGKVNVNDGKHVVGILKDGERVLTEKQDKEYQNMKDMKDKMVSSLSDGEKKPKKEIKEMVHRKSTNGKHIVVHKHHHPEHHPDEEHVMNDMAELHQHMDNHAGTPNEGEAAPAAGAEAPAPMTATPSPMPAPMAGQ